MRITNLSANSGTFTQPGIKQNAARLNFTAGDEDKNHVSPKAAKTIAALGAVTSSIMFGSFVGLLAGLLKSSEGNMSRTKFGVLVGAGTAVVSAIVSAPAAIYNAGVSSFIGKKSVDTFTASNNTQQTILGRLNENAKDPNKDLSATINDYFKFASANNGKTMIIQG